MPSDLGSTLVDSVVRAQRGQAAAFGEIARALHGALVAYAWTIVRDRALAEDAAQEALLEAYDHLDELRDPGAFPAWIFAIVRSRCSRLARHRRSTLAEGDIEAEVAVPATDTVELRRDLQRALATLSAAEREVVVLFYLADMDQRSIGAFLQVPVSTVKNRLHTARRRLKEFLVTDFESDLRAARPVESERFRARVEWFSAVDRGDSASVQRLLGLEPWLLHERRRRDEEPPPGVRWGVTALHVCAKLDHVDVARTLLDAGADPEARATGTGSEGGGTALHWAAHYRQFEMVKLLVERGADVNPEEDTGEAAHTGSPGKNLSLFDDRRIGRYLVDHGARVTLFAAVALELPEQVRALVAADPDALSERQYVEFTALHLAARDDLPAMIDLLVELGAARDATDRFGRAPIDVALRRGHRAAHERLTAHGAVPNDESLEMAGDVARAERLARFFHACLDDLVLAERMLVEEPVLATARLPCFWFDNYVGGTALHLAAALGRTELAELLLRHGADRTLRDQRYGGTPAGWAREFDRPQMAERLGP